MTIKEQEDLLFEEMRADYPEIIDDGIVDEDAYLSAPKKILYLLKEANGGKAWSLRKYLSEGGRAQTWDNIARWTEAIFRIEEELPWEYWVQNRELRRKEFLRKIGAVNVKKTSGGYISNMGEVYNAAIKNGEILSRQISLYKPDILICCGTGQIFVDAVYSNEKTWSMTSRGVPYFLDGEMVVIDFSHPAARVSPCYLLYSLTDAIKEIAETSKKQFERI